jgi:phage terminase small subunit
VTPETTHSTRSKSVVPLWWQEFISEYLKNGENAKQAYLKVKPHCAPSTAEVKGSELVRNGKFSKALQEARVKAESKIDMSREKWLKLVCDVAGFNITELFTENGDLNPKWKELKAAHVIEAIQSASTTNADGQVFSRVQVKAASKIKALELLGKALGYLDEKVNVNHSGKVDLVLSEQVLKDLSAIKSRFPIPGF